FQYPPTTEIYTLSLHDALPIYGQGIFYTLNYLEHLERLNVRVVNNRAAFTIETSKALQLSLLRSLGLPYPRARVINHASQALSADRKSTRLNSSHVAISYAVFC